MLKTKCFQVATLALAVIGFGLVPAGDAFASPCDNSRSSHDRWHSNSHRSSHDSWHGSSHRYGSHDYHRRGFDSRTSVTYRNDNVRFSVSVGSSRSYHQPVYHQPVYHHEPYRHNTYRQKTVVHTTTHHQSSGYWKRVYHPPVYETRYQHCGTPYRVCVSAGYYERVWVSSSYCP